MSESDWDIESWDEEGGQQGEDRPIALEIKKDGEPIVTTVGVEVANFSDKSLVLRQRFYMNPKFISLRNKHEILTPDVFRMVFKVGRTLSETLKYFAHPELMEDESQVDGDPGDARKRMLRP